MANARALEAVDIELKRLWPGKPCELVGRHPNPWRDVLEEIRHRPAARLQEIPHAVVHVLQDIGQLFLLDPHRGRGRRPALEDLGVGSGNLRKLADLVGGRDRRAGHRNASGRKRRGGSSRRNPGPTRKSRHARIGLVQFTAQTPHAAGACLADAFQLGAHLAPATRGEADGNTFFSHTGSLQDVSRYDTFRFMIVSTRGKLAAGAVQDQFGKGFPADIIKRTRAILSALDAAVVLEDLRFPPGNHLEALSGNRTGQHSVRINGQWRICFIWTDQGPAEVEIVDYH